MPSSCPWRTRGPRPRSAACPGSGRCTSSAGPGSRAPTKKSSLDCVTRVERDRDLVPEPSELCVLEQNLENDKDGTQASPELDGAVSTRDPSQTSIRSSQWSFSTMSHGTQSSSRDCCSWTRHPLIQKNRRVVLASFLLLVLGLGLVLVGVGLQAAPSPGVSSAIFFVPGFLLLVPGAYHVTFICCALRGDPGFQPFHLPYFET